MADAKIIPIAKVRTAEPKRCAARTASGRQCRNWATESGYCRRHEPAAAVATENAAAHGGESGALGDAPMEIQVPGSETDLERALAFLRRRLTGNYPTDDFGFDPELTENVLIPLVRPLFQRWWRVEQRGLENLPTEGPALLVANHSGTLPLDAVMMKLGVYEGIRRHCRLLAADLAFRVPFVGALARKSGNTLACNEDVTRLLEAGELVGVFPEGYKGVGKLFRERYKLQRFGRGGFAEVALKSRVPIVPVAIVGAEEIYPMVYDLRPLARLLGFPYFPITPTFPLLGPLGAIPLPSKWIIEYGEPISTEDYPPDAASDPMLVFNLTDEVRESVQQSLYRILMTRRSVFF